MEDAAPRRRNARQSTHRPCQENQITINHARKLKITPLTININNLQQQLNLHLHCYALHPSPQLHNKPQTPNLLPFCHAMPAHRRMAPRCVASLTKVDDVDSYPCHPTLCIAPRCTGDDRYSYFHFPLLPLVFRNMCVARIAGGSFRCSSHCRATMSTDGPRAVPKLPRGRSFIAGSSRADSAPRSCRFSHERAELNRTLTL